MHVINARNVNWALPAGLDYLLTHGAREESRNGPVLVAPGPVTTVFRNPQERVLLSRVRRANPFFHLAEALWMLAGRDDARFLNNFVHDFGERFAEPSGHLHGAYGHRWRHAFDLDQIDSVISILQHDPSSRRCVLQMWDCEADLAGDSRERPCNTHIYLRMRSEGGGLGVVNSLGPAPTTTRYLDITVCCRSNDIIWGAYGANAVHMSVLQEYLAAMVGAYVGVYYQVSNNFHAYVSEVERLGRRAVEQGHMWPNNLQHQGRELVPALLDTRQFSIQPLVHSAEDFDAELLWLLEAYEETANTQAVVPFKNKFLGETAWPMLMAHRTWKQKLDPEPWLRKIQASDWHTACKEWITPP